VLEGLLTLDMSEKEQIYQINKLLKSLADVPLDLLELDKNDLRTSASKLLADLTDPLQSVSQTHKEKKSISFESKPL
jgi:hypothetical protein